MPRVLPSEAAAAIVQAFPWAGEWVEGRRTAGSSLGPEHSPAIAMIVRLVTSIPDELRPTDASMRVRLECALGLMEGALVSWAGAPHDGFAARLTENGATGGDPPVVAVLRALKTCPDTIVGEERPKFAYVADADARADLRSDIGAALRAYAVADYKTATVMGGTVLEAVLLHRVVHLKDLARNSAIKAVVKVRPKAETPLKSDPENWTLENLVDVALEASEIDPDTHKIAHAVRNFRNLIHPGRAIRRGEKCSRGEAMSALGAMLRLVERFE